MSTYITVSSQCSEAEFLNTVRIKGLLRYNMDKTGGKLKVPDLEIVRVARNTDNVLVGGASGTTYLSAVEIEVLWVDEPYRKQHIASRMLTEIEEEARAADCRLSYLTTYSFQAPRFYIKHGYEICGEVDGFVDGIKLYMLQKPL